MARRRTSLPRFLTFGDRVPPSLGLVLALMLVASVAGWMNGEIQELAALSPARIVRGEVWRLVSWAFVQNDPLTLLFGGFILYWVGQQLAFVWSERRFLLRFFSYAVFASVATTLLAYLGGPAPRAHLGMYPVVNAFILSWALLYPDRQVNIWGVLPLTGRTLGWLLLGGTLLYGIAAGGIAGIGLFAPHLFALGLAWALSRGLGARTPWRDARSWWAERDAKRRARHLKVVKRDGGDDRPRWLN